MKKQKLIKALTGTVITVLLAITAVLSHHIYKQNQLIEAQSKNLAEQKQELTGQADEIATKEQEITRQSGEITAKEEQAYGQALWDNCVLGAEKSLVQLERGDRTGALETALSVYPREENEDLPCTPQVSYALAEGLQVYANGSRTVPDMRLETGGQISLVRVSKDGSRIMALDDTGEYGTVWVWLTEDGTLTDRFMLGSSAAGKKEGFEFIDDTRFVCPTAGGYALCDTQKHAIAYEKAAYDYRTVTANESGDKYVMWGEARFNMIDAETGNVLHWADTEDWDYHTFSYCDSNFVFCQDDRYAMAGAGTQKKLKIYDAADGTLLQTYPLSEDSIAFLRYADGVLYVAQQEEHKLTNNKYDMSVITTLSAIDLDREEVLWTYQRMGLNFRDVVVSKDGDCPYLALVGYDEVIILDRTDGSYHDSYYFDSPISAYGDSINDDTLLVITKDDAWRYLYLQYGTYRTEENFVYKTQYNVDEIIKDNLVTVLHREHDIDSAATNTAVMLYRSPVRADSEIFLEGGDDADYIAGFVDQTGQYLAVQRQKQNVDLAVYDTASGALLWSYRPDEQDGEESFMALGFYPEREALFLITGEGIRLFEQPAGKMLDYYTYDEERYDKYVSGWHAGLDITGDYIGADETGRYVFIKEYDMIFGYDLSDGSIAYRITMAEGESLGKGGMDYAISPGMEYLAMTNMYTKSLQLYRLDDWRTQKDTDSESGLSPKCVAEWSGVHADSVTALFFGRGEGSSGNVELYVMYSDGYMEAYFVKENIDQLPARIYRGLNNTLTHMVSVPGRDYAVAAGSSGADAYMISDAGDAGHGQIMARMEGFLAWDSANNQIYLTDRYGKSVYRVPVYDADMLAEQAKAMLK